MISQVEIEIFNLILIIILVIVDNFVPMIDRIDNRYFNHGLKVKFQYFNLKFHRSLSQHHSPLGLSRDLSSVLYVLF